MWEERGRAGRVALIDERFLWPDALVPFRVDDANFSKYYETIFARFSLSLVDRRGTNRLRSSGSGKIDGSFVLAICSLQS